MYPPHKVCHFANCHQMELEALQLVEFAYNRQRGEPRYIPFRHRGVPPRYPAFDLLLPVLLLPWDDERGGVMCFAHPLHQAPLASDASNQDEMALLGVLFPTWLLGICPTYDVALKIMDKTQLKLQHDDVLNEVRVMAQLQPPGFSGVYHSPHLSQWECLADEHNEYIAMDWAANGSLIMYAKRRLTDYKRFAVERLVNRMTSLPELEHAVNTFVSRAWMLEALYIFEGVLKGLAYMHAQNVCHLDVDPCNVVIDADYNPRVIDFGSSEIMTNNGRAGADDRLIKFKPLYVAEEVRAHNQRPSPRPGFLGAPPILLVRKLWDAALSTLELFADVLYQLLCFGYPKGHLALVCDTNWATNLLAHANQPGYDQCLGQDGCLICFRRIEFPDVIFEIFRGLLLADRPTERLTAVEAANLLRPLLIDYDVDFNRRSQSVLDTLG
ncbi:Protein kinase domain [Phytophthora infestans]|uniref:non-specific serine/threonine protein kinase n=1 Tax=Phytophthora infestans TaxID=4787 RepID=A0A833SMB9_PHYIN|nr:Protein kinase domain [Phytophthora infestans]